MSSKCESGNEETATKFLCAQKTTNNSISLKTLSKTLFVELIWYIECHFAVNIVRKQSQFAVISLHFAIALIDLKSSHMTALKELSVGVETREPNPSVVSYRRFVTFSVQVMHFSWGVRLMSFLGLNIVLRLKKGFKNIIMNLQ